MIRRPRSRGAMWVAGAVVAAVAAAVVVDAVDREALAAAVGAVAERPAAVVAVLGVYGLAFVLRAVAWTRVLPALGAGHALAAIHVALLGNHLLPFRLGEPLRVTSAVRRARVPLAEATASTVSLRAADLVAMAVLAFAVGPRVVLDLAGAWGLVVAGLAMVGVAAGAVWLRRLRDAGRLEVRVPGIGVALLALAAWAAEAVVVWFAAWSAGVSLTPAEAVLVTVVTVAAQLAAVAPGGFGTYEAAGTAVMVALGVDAGTALAVALTAHALKTGYSLVAGGVALFVPSPGMVGRLRLPGRRAPGPPRDRAVPADAPVVFFLPARDEQATVGDVVRRIPATVAGRPVVPIVVDDGSVDRTAEEAERAGALVLRSPVNQGLGAAVRRGLRAGVERGAAAVVFCDADGEYAPEELDRLVAPIVAGEADYVVGSRFGGEIERMLPHRRLGNRVLTLALRFVAREPVSDGQSGYRALSGQAAAAADVAHDFNYAQVLTLDLLAKGFRYAEVPISYRFRTHGESFVRLGRYLRHVVPAVYRVVNRPAVRPVRG